MPHQVSIELVPRSRESLASDLALIARRFPSVRTTNIPDLLKFELRSWDACAQARGVLERAIPHVRAMDFAIADAPRLVSILAERDLNEVLVVRGDPPQDMARPVHPTESADLIRALKMAAPQLEVYAAFDPYRRGLREELEGVQAKLDAGATALFSQPLFDLRFMQLCADQLTGVPTYWGLAPVVRAGSRRYWEVKNRAFFPSSFEPTLAWNREFAARCLAWADECDQALYFMPIRVSIEDYLQGIL